MADTVFFDFPQASWPPGAEDLRADVRKFLSQWQTGTDAYQPRCDSWLAGFSPEFSQGLGARGWIGMTWPRKYGGGERSALERYVVTEELLAAGAPVAAHWIADRQTGPAILQFGTEDQKARFLPAMARGECYFAIGMSEPDTGSDLASVRTKALRSSDGWLISGSKIWTSHAHRADFMVVLCRTESGTDATDRHSGLSQFIVDLRSSSGVSIRPIQLITGEAHFNEVVFEDVFVPDSMVLGDIGNGWQQVTAELANERSGPERFMSTFPILPELGRWARDTGDERMTATLAETWVRLWAVRRLSLSVASLLDRGESPAVAAALVKTLGTELEQDIVEAARLVFPAVISSDAEDSAGQRIAEGLLHSPGYTLRGGSNEILRGIVARGLGLR